MHRRPFRSSLPLLLLLGLSLPRPALAATPWPSVQGNQYYTGNNDETLPSTFTVVWRTAFPSAVLWPVPLDDTVLLGGLDGKLRRLSLADGRILWTADCGAPLTHSAVHDGRRIAVTAGRTLLCLDAASGSVLWSRTDPRHHIYIHPLIAGHRVLYGTRKKLSCLVLSNGALLWENERPELYGASMTVQGDTLVLQSSDYATRTFTVEAYDIRNGQPVWQHPLSRQGPIFTPVIYQGRVYTAAGNSVVCLDLRTGARIWSRDLPAPAGSETTFSSGRLVLATDEGTVHILDPADGHTLKLIPLSPGRIFFAAVGEELIVLESATGVLWKAGPEGPPQPLFRTGRPGSGQRFVVHDRAVLLALNTNLWCLGEPRITSPRPPAGRLLSGRITDPQGHPLRAELILPSGRRLPVEGDFSVPLEPSVTDLTVTAADHLATNILLGPTNRRVEVALRPARRESRFTLRTILFDYNSSTLRPESIPVLDSLRDHLLNDPSRRLVIRGHTDSVGSDEFNLRLSLRRAERVREYLVKNGVLESRLEIQGAGEAEPVADNSTEEGRRLNRRIEFILR